MPGCIGTGEKRMDITYRRLVQDDLEAFIAIRITQLRGEGAKDRTDLAPALRDYYRRHLADGTFVSWLALEGVTLASSWIFFPFPT